MAGQRASQQTVWKVCVFGAIQPNLQHDLCLHASRKDAATDPETNSKRQQLQLLGDQTALSQAQLNSSSAQRRGDGT